MENAGLEFLAEEDDGGLGGLVMDALGELDASCPMGDAGGAAGGAASVLLHLSPSERQAWLARELVARPELDGVLDACFDCLLIGASPTPAASLEAKRRKAQGSLAEKRREMATPRGTPTAWDRQLSESLGQALQAQEVALRDTCVEVQAVHRDLQHTVAALEEELGRILGAQAPLQRKGRVGLLAGTPTPRNSMARRKGPDPLLASGGGHLGPLVEATVEEDPPAETYDDKGAPGRMEVDEPAGGERPGLAQETGAAPTGKPTPAWAALDHEVVAAKNETTIRRELKRRFAERIVEMADEMAQKRPKSCIAPAATQVLDKWYRDHFAFPYPSDGDKEALALRTGLSLDQVNNWFINRRKRHWIKAFQHKKPQSREEALRELKALGIVDQRGRCIAAIDSEAADA